MPFDLDIQTIKDLQIFDSSPVNVFSIFDQTKTEGGNLVLKELMKNPLDNYRVLKGRRDKLKFIHDTAMTLEIKSSQLKLVEHYLNLNVSILKKNFLDAFLENLAHKRNSKNDYYLIRTGIRILSLLIAELQRFVFAVQQKKDVPEGIVDMVELLENFMKIKEIQHLPQKEGYLTHRVIHHLDDVFRRKYKKEIREVLQIIYTLDAYSAIVQAIDQYGFSFPEYQSKQGKMEMIGLFHPLLKNPVPNDILIEGSKNLFFLTGANMAGKSTFLKSLGLSIYLAHIGFPVPAKKMKTKIYKGLVTTINLSDDLARGHSHFYAEVQRVKELALKIKNHKTMFVICDELFRGTNVKDAHDASLLVINEMSKIKHCTFFISSHITEIVDEIKGKENVELLFLGADLKKDGSELTFKLQKGVSYERYGLELVKKARIVEIFSGLKE